MNEDAWLAERFEEHRARLGAVANRMLGSPHEADDAVQEAWLRFSRSDTSSVENLGSWLTTVISRVCLNMLQARRSRPETPASPDMPEPAVSPATRSDPEHEALLADSIGLALLVVLDTLSPPERVALVLHDMFGMPFEEIAPIIGRTAPAARQLASRARRRVRGHGAPEGCDRVRQATLVEAFLAASRNGDFNALLAHSTPVSCFAPTRQPPIWASPPRSWGHQTSPHSSGAPAAPGPRWSTDSPEPSGCQAASHASSSASPSATTRSSASSWPPPRNASATSTS